jgi:hypothetical protein
MGVALYTTAGLICVAVSVVAVVLLAAALRAPATRRSEVLAAVGAATLVVMTGVYAERGLWPVSVTLLAIAAVGCVTIARRR